MSKKTLEDAFGNSIPLEEALKEEPLEEFTEEDIELAGMGFDLNIVDVYRKRFEKDSVIHQGYATNDLVDYYLECCDEVRLSRLREHLESFRESQQEKISTYEVIEVVKPPEDDTFAGYIQKNSELMRENERLKEQLQHYITLHDEGKDHLKKYINYFELAKKLVSIFIEQGTTTDKLTKEDIELVKEVAGNE